MHGLGVATLFMILEYNTVQGQGVQHCAWYWSKTLCMVIECIIVHGLGSTTLCMVMELQHSA